MTTAQTQKMEKAKKTEKILTYIGLVLAAGGAVLIYLRSSSVWLTIFVFIMISRFMIGSLPKIIFHPRKIYRTLFYLLWPAGGTLILYLVYQQWEIMWLAAVLGIVGGMFFSVLVGYFLFRDIVMEDQQLESQASDYMVEEKLAKHPDAVATKERFSTSEWDEIKLLPLMVCAMVAMAGGETYMQGLAVFTDLMIDPKGIEDPLLRMMLLDYGANIKRSMGQMDSLTQVFAGMSGKVSDHEIERLAQSGKLSAQFEGLFNVSPQALPIIESNLNPDDYRSFIKSLAEFGLQVASAGDSITQTQIDVIFKFVPIESKEDLIAMFGG